MHRQFFRSPALLFVTFAAAVAFMGCDSTEADLPSPSASGTVEAGINPASVAGGDEQINQLTSACQGWWRINNDARPDMLYTWEHLPSGATGDVSVAAGDRAFFQTPHYPDNANTTRLRDEGGAVVSTKASNNAPCWTLSGHVNAVPDGSTNPSAGEGIANVLVQVFFAGADPATDPPIYEMLTDADGAYTFTDLPAWTSPTVEYVEYLVVVPEFVTSEASGTFNESLFAFFDAINHPLTVQLPNADVVDADLGFDGDDAAFIAEIDRINTAGERTPWSQKDLRKAFDRARKNKPCHNAVLCRDELLEVTRQIVDDPDDPTDYFFGLSFPYAGPDGEPDGSTYSDAEILEWGYEVLKDVPQGPQDPSARLYSLVFAVQINFLRERGLEDVALDLALQGYFEADVAANPPQGLRVPSRILSQAFGTATEQSADQRAGGGGGGTIEVARIYLGGGGGGTVEG